VPALQLGAAEKYAVAANFTDTKHGELGCIACHGGNNVQDMAQAHTGIVTDPSVQAGGICNQCHADQAEHFANSLHYTFNGAVKSLETFSHPGVLGEDGGLTKVFNSNCNNCHATCGQCHVSRPNAVAGGLYAEHAFAADPPTDDTCYNCHGARSAGEYLGQVGLNSDVHFSRADLDCTGCHPATNFHGAANEATEKFASTDLPKCTDCHQDVYAGTTQIAMHKAHPADTLSCQVCHSTANNNCYSCHLNFQDDKAVSHSDTKLQFKIALNPDRDELHPEKYITVRHIPTLAASFTAAGEDLLPNYDAVPNWKLSPTHNIQRYTPQNGSCTSCHGKATLFLTEKDLVEGDSKANEELLVKTIPPAFE